MSALPSTALQPSLTEVLELLDHALQLQGRAQHFSPDTPLLGSLPELDSLAVADILAGMEARWGIAADAELDAHTFANVRNLTHYLQARHPQQP